MPPTIHLPSHFIFNTTIPVRIYDINYGQHLGHDSLISLLHEARLQFLTAHKLTEFNMFGAGWLMVGLTVAYKNQAFYGDKLNISLHLSNASKSTLDVIHLVTNETTKKEIARAKATFACFDFNTQKVRRIPEKLLAFCS